MLQAIGNNLVVKPVFEEAKSILVMPTADIPIYYEVLSIGDKVDEIEVGDKIFIDQYGVEEKSLKGEKFFTASSEFIYAKVVIA